MAISRITCPDCKSVLKPAKPVPDGKKVKCPKCGTMFTTPGLVEDEEDRPRKSKEAGRKEKAGIKKASTAKSAAPKPAPKKPVDDDAEDDGGGGIYATVQEEVKAEGDKPDIEYAPDMSIKDLRGPAQAAVVRPSNYLLLIGGISALLDIFIICVSFWPMVFSESVVDYHEVLTKHYKDDKKAKSRIDSIKERKDIKDKDLDVVEEAEGDARFWRFLFLGIFILLLVYSGVAIIGAVKMQNLESRGWGIASSIMVMLPFGSSGICVAVGFLFYLLFAMLLDDASMGLMYAGGVSGLVWILAVVVGVWSLRTLLSQEVRDGFEYVAE